MITKYTEKTFYQDRRSGGEGKGVGGRGEEGGRRGTVRKKKRGRR